MTVSVTVTAQGAEAAQRVVGPRASRAPASAEQPAVGERRVMAVGPWEPDVDLAYHATYEECVASITAEGLNDDSDITGRRELDEDEPRAVYLWGEEEEAVTFCQEFGRDTIVVVNVFGLEPERDETASLTSLSYGGTDYVSAFFVRGTIGPDRILDTWPSCLGTPKRVGFDGFGFPKDPFYDGS